MIYCNNYTNHGNNVLLKNHEMEEIRDISDFYDHIALTLAIFHDYKNFDNKEIQFQVFTCRQQMTFRLMINVVFMTYLQRLTWHVNTNTFQEH